MNDPDIPAGGQSAQTDGADRPGIGRLVGIAVGVLLSLGIVTLLIVGLTRDSAPINVDHRIADGERVPAPDFTLPVFANGGSLGPVGTPVTLSDLRGTPVIVNFWADWCPPCHEEAPILERLYRRFGARVAFLTVNVEDDPDSARAFLAEHHATFPVLRTGNARVRLLYGTKSMPETFVIDPDGSFGMTGFRGQLTVESEAEIADHLTQVLDAR